MNRSKIGDRLIFAREKAELSRSQVAQSIGIGTTTLQQWEMGNREASIEKISELAKLYKVSPQYLIFGEDNNVPANPDSTRTITKSNISVEAAVATLQAMIEESQPKLTEDEAFLLKEFRTLDADQKKLILRFLVAGFDGLNKAVINGSNLNIENSFDG